MAETIIPSECKPVNPLIEEDAFRAAIDACRAEMERAQRAADWRALVAECAAAGKP